MKKDFLKYMNLPMEEFLEEVLFHSIHNHSDYSNLRLLDCTNKIKKLVDTAIELDYKGVCISEHENLSSHIQLMQYTQELKEKKKQYNNIINDKSLSKEETTNKLMREFKEQLKIIEKMPEDFKVGFGNEIYLVDNLESVRENYVSGKTKFYHFILQALDKVGHEQLRKISTSAWKNYYKQGKMERVPTLKSTLKDIIGVNKGHMIGSTACLGGFLGQKILQLISLTKQQNNEQEIYKTKVEIHEFIMYCINVFGQENFYIELQPSFMEEQIEVNKIAINIAKAYKLKFIITTDSHYFRPENRQTHKFYLNSKEGDREIDDFYSSTYMMKTKEIWDYVKDYISEEDFKICILNTLDIANKTEEYSLNQTQIIPQRKLPKTFSLKHILKNWYSKCPFLQKCAFSEYDQDRFFMFMVEKGLIEKNITLCDKVAERINIEIKELFGISERLGQRMTSYYNLTQLIVDIIWDDNMGNSLVGVARGSVAGFFTAYLLDITQINPIQWDLVHWRHITELRPELPDIDLDSESLKRSLIFKSLKEYFGYDRVLNIATFKTEGSKSAILTSARGLNIDIDIAKSVADLIPFERGKNWSIEDCVYGNEEKKRKPIKEFINAINQYENWLKTAMDLEGIVCGRSIHASGVYIFNDNFIKQNSLMKAPNGLDITCWSMADSDWAGGLKLDCLTIEALDKIRVTMELLGKAKKIEWQGSLRDTYNKYLHPDKLNYENKKMWEKVGEGVIPDLFQFSTQIGIQTAKLIKPMNLTELAHANSLMRLMGDGTITPCQKYINFRNDINLWYEEMRLYKLTEEEIKILEKYLLKYYGVSATQEDIMILSMDKKIANFDLVLANKLRKAIAKKVDKLVKEIKNEFFKQGLEANNSINMLNYVWDKHIVPQLGYSFSINHTTPYSIICLQEMNLVSKYGEIYWNTAVLTINAGASSEEEYDEEDTEVKKNRNTAYGKIAKAIGDMKTHNVNIGLPNINKSEFGFSIDEENNKILYGLKGIGGVGDNIAKEIIVNRPFKSLQDFCDRMVKKDMCGNVNVISLIKCGAFDELEDKPREEILKEYIKKISKFKNSLTMDSLNKLIENNLVPEQFLLQIRFYKYRKYIYSKKFFVRKDLIKGSKKWFILDDISTEFFIKYFIDDLIEEKDYKYNEEGKILVLDKNFDKIYEKKIVELKSWLKQEEVTKQYNNMLFKEIWNKYCLGSKSKWEMDTLSFYYNEHELSKIDYDKYNVENFFELDEEPIVVEESKRGNRIFKKFKLSKIIGTVLDKNKNKNIVDILTPDGVVSCKFYNGSFNYYDKQLSVLDVNTNKKKVVEKSWFTRGNKLIIVGFRRGEQFVPRVYKNSIYEHSIQKITEVMGDKLIVENERQYINQ